ncbi:hypothetical protein IJG90_03725 [Candidatus Saccharibacteria bacterium]|nr:hypothetical protein [Candidatus Saccharibacteria bacterium]
MNVEKLTSKILEKLKPANILYAEFAEGGAMGEAGTARLYYLDGNTIHFYLVNLSDASTEEDIHAYADAYTFLHDLESNKILKYAAGGFGNHAWKHRDLTFLRDDDNHSFIYQKGKTAHSLTTSVPGVYFHVVADFAKRPADLKALTKFRKKVARHATPSEIAFYDAYLEQIERNDNGIPYFDLTVDDYWSAIIYLRYLNLEEFNLSEDLLTTGLKALQKYRLKYLISHFGWRVLDQFIAELAEAKLTDIFFEINKFINNLDAKKHDENYVAFNINNLLCDIQYLSSNWTSLEPADSQCITHLFEYPVIIKFTDAAHADILHSISKMDGPALRTNAEAISYYIANFIFNEDTLSYADLLPICTHIIEDLPNNDPNHTKPEYLFWLASDVVDRVWRYISESKVAQKKCRDLVYDLFAPRVGGLWPIAHYNDFHFNDTSADVIFRESVDFLMSLSDLTDRNEQLKDYLALYRNGFTYPIESVARRAFFETLKDIESSEGKFEKILEVRAPQEYASYLAHPDTVKEATRVLEELFRTDDGARITGMHRIATFEKLLLNGNSIGVSVAILNYLVSNFDAFSAIITKDCEVCKLDPLDVITSLYTAAACGATEENELPPLKALTKKISKYVTKLQIEQTMHAGSLKGKDIRTSTIDVDSITEAALRYARKHRRTILFQRSALQKFF